MKKAFIITGPESSGSTFISQVIAKSLKQIKSLNEWNGRQFCNNKLPNKDEKDDIIILHRSQPFGNENYFTYNNFKRLFKGYEMNFIICTRYIEISNLSKKSRFNRTDNEINKSIIKSREIIKDICKNEKYFIWNYETMNYLQELYFDMLYEFLNVKCNYYPNNIFDGNKKYVINS